MNLGDFRPSMTVASGTSIVLRGQFRPSLFSPAWFRSADLIDEGEYLEHDLRTISRDVADFTVGTIDVYITNDLLQLGSKNPGHATRLRDLAIGTLMELRHTPVSAMGINRAFHARVSSNEAMHRVGDVLAPKQPWAGLLRTPGMRAIETWGVRNDGWEGRVGVVVEPSDTVQPGVYVNVNDHFELEPVRRDVTRDDAFLGQDSPSEATRDKRRQALEILASGWNVSATLATDLRDRVLQLAD